MRSHLCWEGDIVRALSLRSRRGAMVLLSRVSAVYLIVLAVVIAVNLVITPLYHPGGDEPYTV